MGEVAGRASMDSGILVALSSRLVFSLLRGAVRLAARFEMPMAKLIQLTRLAYFAELRRQSPRDLAWVADRLDLSVRTAGSMNKVLKGDFFAPETEVQPIRDVTRILLKGPQTTDQLMAATGLGAGETSRVVHLLQANGWVASADGTHTMKSGVRSFVTADLDRRIDGLNNQMDLLTRSVWSRFVDGDDTHAAARSWVFAAESHAFQAFSARAIRELRHGAVDLEEAALRDGHHDRYAVTIAFSAMGDET